jgi:hypothetical protein
MNRFAVCALALAFLPLVHAQKTRYGQEPPKAKAGVDYPIKLHVSGIRAGSHCSSNLGRPATCNDVLFADAVVDGQKLELMGDWIWYSKYYALSLTPGDYEARLVKPAPAGSKTAMFQEYEFLLPDKTIWRCTVNGVSE